MDSVTKEKRSRIMSRTRSRRDRLIANALRHGGVKGWRSRRTLWGVPVNFLWKTERLCILIQRCFDHGVRTSLNPKRFMVFRQDEWWVLKIFECKVHRMTPTEVSAQAAKLLAAVGRSA